MTALIPSPRKRTLSARLTYSLGRNCERNEGVRETSLHPLAHYLITIAPPSAHCPAHIHLEEEIEPEEGSTGVQREQSCIPHRDAVAGLLTPGLKGEATS